MESVHATIRRPAQRPRRARGIAGWVYRLVRGITRGVGWALDRGLSLADRPRAGDDLAEGSYRDAVVAALNGAFGDELAASGNPLATPLQIRHAARTLTLDEDSLARAVPDASDTVLVFAHGICMHDGQWGDDDHDPPSVLANALGATPVFLRYNSGRHISETGRDVADALEVLVDAWPRPIRRLVVVGHSMSPGARSTSGPRPGTPGPTSTPRS